MAGKGDDNRGRSDIMDISDTPDVAVWAKEIRRGANMPSDRVKEPSKNSSMMLHIVTRSSSSAAATIAEKEGGLAVDPASKKEVSAARATLTDESEYAKRE